MKCNVHAEILHDLIIPVECWYQHLITSSQTLDVNGTSPPPSLACNTRNRTLLCCKIRFVIDTSENKILKTSTVEKKETPQRQVTQKLHHELDTHLTLSLYLVTCLENPFVLCDQEKSVILCIVPMGIDQNRHSETKRYLWAKRINFTDKRPEQTN